MAGILKVILYFQSNKVQYKFFSTMMTLSYVIPLDQAELNTNKVRPNVCMWYKSAIILIINFVFIAIGFFLLLSGKFASKV